MQQKAHYHKKSGPSAAKILPVLLVVVIVAGLASLALVNIPAPQKSIEKELDAKVFLEQKPQ